MYSYINIKDVKNYLLNLGLIVGFETFDFLLAFIIASFSFLRVSANCL
jgi:hypothetical protein